MRALRLLVVLVGVVLALGPVCWTDAEAARRTAKGPGAEVSEKRPVNINTASDVELTQLPRIGPAIAKRIVEFREEHGRFQRVDDLLKVRGISEKTLEKLRPFVTIGKSKGR